MAKQKPNQSPQELYKARKEKEEREKVAHLPPGLYNHGNTCFMNSVLQGLIATRLLSDLVHFQPVPLSTQYHTTLPIASRRSPQLTNGHSLAGPHERPWVDTMPIGDEFLTVLWKAWGAQNHRRRESISPKLLLQTVGLKYDQYLDFGQQDAHEFLRILLDAIRMEEFDVIKKSLPPADKSRKRRRAVIKTSPTTDAPNGNAEDDRLISLSDMVFGGQLTSLLVCQKCKHISQTYEDFNDLSLSIKPEDYTQERKRDKLKNLAKKLTSFPTPSPQGPISSPPERRNAVDILRAASVPPTNKPEENKLQGLEDPPIADPPRRKSFQGTPETGPEEPAEVTAVVEDATPGPNAILKGGAAISDKDSPRHSTSSTTGSTPPERHVEFLKPNKEEQEKKEKKDSDPWTKFGKRISLTVGLRRGKGRSRSKERKSVDLGKLDITKFPITDETSASVSEPSGDGHSNVLLVKQEIPIITHQAPTPTIDRTSDTTPTSSKSLERQSLPAHPIDTTANSPFSPLFPTIQRNKSFKAPKGTPAEAAYMRRILADVTPTSSSPSPFALFKAAGQHHLGSNLTSQSSSGPSSVPTPTASHWLGNPTLTGLEECLRLFTTVEVLDGENMVGCRRCWKLANGQRTPSKNEMDDDDDDYDNEEEEEEEVETEVRVEGVDAETRGSRKPSLGIVVPGVEGGKSTSTPGGANAILHASLLSSSLNSPIAQIPSSRSTPAVYALDQPLSDIEGVSPSVSVSSLPGDMPVTQGHSDDGHGVAEQRIANQPGTPISPTQPGLGRVLSHHLPSSRPIRRSSLTPAPGARWNGQPASVTREIIDGDSSDPESASASDNESESGLSSAERSHGQPRSPTSVDRSLAGVAGVAGTGGKRAMIPSPPPTPSTSGSGVAKIIERDSGTPSSSEGSMVHVRREDAEDSGIDTEEPAPAPAPAIPSSRRSSLKMKTTSQSTLMPPTVSTRKTQKSSKAKPVIMRPAYKRYLISIPPPVLVVHFKRFQQATPSNKLFSASSSSPLPYYNIFGSFSQGFKKLDDYITFPEYLDLGPYLAPRREDYGLGGNGTPSTPSGLKFGKKKEEREKCMYRLYAVVVHIGNMLGGHYVAYTALPNEAAVQAALSNSPLANSSTSSSSSASNSSTTQVSTDPSSSSVSSSSPKSLTTIITSSSSTHSTDSAQSSVSTTATSDNDSNNKSPPSTPVPTSKSGASASASTPSMTSTTTLAPSTTTSISTSTHAPVIPTPATPTTARSTSGASKPSHHQERQWAYISDTIVKLTSLEEVLKAKAYLCFYERI